VEDRGGGACGEVEENKGGGRTKGIVPEIWQADKAATSQAEGGVNPSMKVSSSSSSSTSPSSSGRRPCLSVYPRAAVACGGGVGRPPCENRLPLHGHHALIWAPGTPADRSRRFELQAGVSTAARRADGFGIL